MTSLCNMVTEKFYCYKKFGQENSSRSFFIFKVPYNKEFEEVCMLILTYIPVDIYILKVNNRNTRASYEICSKLTIKTSE